MTLDGQLAAEDRVLEEVDGTILGTTEIVAHLVEPGRRSPLCGAEVVGRITHPNGLDRRATTCPRCARARRESLAADGGRAAAEQDLDEGQVGVGVPRLRREVARPAVGVDLGETIGVVQLSRWEAAALGIGLVGLSAAVGAAVLR